MPYRSPAERLNDFANFALSTPFSLVTVAEATNTLKTMTHPKTPAPIIDQGGKYVDSVLPPENRTWLHRSLMWMWGKKYETMSGNGLCPVYLERWRPFEHFFSLFGWGLYLHHFLGNDWSKDPHDHPRRFISIGLWGWYDEDVYYDKHMPGVKYHVLGQYSRYADRGDLKETIRHHAPWFRTFPANHLHRVRAAEHGNVWTLVIVLRKSQPWGFVKPDGSWQGWKDYLQKKGWLGRTDC